MNGVLENLELTIIGTPYLAIVGDNKVIDRQNGFADYDKLFEFLQKNKIIKEDAELLLNYIGINEYDSGYCPCTFKNVIWNASEPNIDEKNINNKYVKLKLKINSVNDCLKKISLIDSKVTNSVKSDLEYEYRNKLQLPIRNINGENKIGFFAQNSHRIVEISSSEIPFCFNLYSNSRLLF